MTAKFIGLDVHKDTIAVAVADTDGAREVRFHGTIANTAEAVRRLVARLSGPDTALRFCYEAGRAAMASTASSRGSAWTAWSSPPQ